MASTPESDARGPLLTPLLAWFLLAMILANIAGSMTGVLMPIYLTELGATVEQVGLVFTLTSIVILALQILGGWISDSIGRLRAIAIGSLGGVIGFVAMLIAPSWPWMLLALAINQVPYALVGPSFGAFIAENSTESNRGKVYGLTDTLYQVVGIVGPPLGGWVAGLYGFRSMLLIATGFYAAAAGLRIWMARTMRPGGDPEARPLTLATFKESAALIGSLLFGGGIVTWIFVTDGVRDVAFRLSGELEPLYLAQIGHLSLAQIGLLSSFFSAAMMVTPLLSGRLADRYGERVPISSGFFVMFVAFMVFLTAQDYPAFIATWLLFGAGVGLLSPAYQSLISKVVPSHSLGLFNGLFQSSLGFLSLPAPWLGALLWERYDPRLPFLITAVVSLFTIVPTWLKFRIPVATPAVVPVQAEEAP
ncbi:MAG: MFS transporter [Anaerolineales bacterium]|nr:MFS transporter [Anaerolineales bacterium]